VNTSATLNLVGHHKQRMRGGCLSSPAASRMRNSRSAMCFVCAVTLEWLAVDNEGSLSMRSGIGLTESEEVNPDEDERYRTGEVE